MSTVESKESSQKTKHKRHKSNLDLDFNWQADSKGSQDKIRKVEIPTSLETTAIHGKILYIFGGGHKEFYESVSKLQNEYNGYCEENIIIYANNEGKDGITAEQLNACLKINGIRKVVICAHGGLHNKDGNFVHLNTPEDDVENDKEICHHISLYEGKLSKTEEIIELIAEAIPGVTIDVSSCYGGYLAKGYLQNPARKTTGGADLFFHSAYVGTGFMDISQYLTHQSFMRKHDELWSMYERIKLHPSPVYAVYRNNTRRHFAVTDINQVDTIEKANAFIIAWFGKYFGVEVPPPFNGDHCEEFQSWIAMLCREKIGHRVGISCKSPNNTDLEENTKDIKAWINLLCKICDKGMVEMALASSMKTAIEKGNYEFVRLLLDGGANANEKYNEKTPLHFALENEKPEIFELLLERGAKAEGENLKEIIDRNRLVEFDILSKYYYIDPLQPMPGLQPRFGGHTATILETCITQGRADFLRQFIQDEENPLDVSKRCAYYKEEQCSKGGQCITPLEFVIRTGGFSAFCARTILKSLQEKEDINWYAQNGLPLMKLAIDYSMQNNQCGTVCAIIEEFPHLITERFSDLPGRDDAIEYVNRLLGEHDKDSQEHQVLHIILGGMEEILSKEKEKNEPKENDTNPESKIEEEQKTKNDTIDTSSLGSVAARKARLQEAVNNRNHKPTPKKPAYSLQQSVTTMAGSTGTPPENTACNVVPNGRVAGLVAQFNNRDKT